MSLVLAVETGDATAENKAVRKFQIEIDRPPGRVRLSMAGIDGAIDCDDWPKLVEQVKEGDLVKRKFPQGLQSPLTAIASVIRQITSTPTFQLFLAGVDIAERIDMMSDSPLEYVQRRFKLLDKWMPSVTGAGGLFFIPESIVSHFEPPATNDLILNNKICTATFADITRYYVPYATPISFVSHPSREAEKLWDEIRSSYYAFRHSA